MMTYAFRICVSLAVFVFVLALIFIDPNTDWRGVFIVGFCSVWNWLHAHEEYEKEKARKWKNTKH